ncbi:MAG: hypothetical protein IPO19_15245 [Rhodoferax sp.]|nr:hypothetical protein [Rhodoferax sp.]
MGSLSQAVLALWFCLLASRCRCGPAITDYTHFSPNTRNGGGAAGWQEAVLDISRRYLPHPNAVRHA